MTRGTTADVDRDPWQKRNRLQQNQRNDRKTAAVDLRHACDR